MDIKEKIKSSTIEELRDMQDLVNREIQSRRSSSGKSQKILTYTDGASRGNPVDAGIGALIFDDKDEKIYQDFRYIGVCTNNEAEYRALLMVLDQASDITQNEVECYLDSELVVKQLNGFYKIKSEKMLKFNTEVKVRMSKFNKITFNHVRRSHPRLLLADKLANRGIDEAKPKKI